MEIQSLAPNFRKRTMVLIQSRSVNIKISGGGEHGLVMLFISFNENISNVSENSYT